VILAAGGSARFGAPKQLLTYHGENLVQRAARVAIEAGLDPVIVVLGAYASSIESFLSEFPEVIVAINDRWESGQASSLRVGIEEAIVAGSDAALIMLADQPLIDASSIARLVAAFDNQHRIVASWYNGIHGVPAVFGTELFPELLALTGDHGAGPWIRKRTNKVTAVTMDEATFDIDTQDDLKHLPHD